ncbi:MAG: AsmA-like C-terminal domain-containing protein, partial [Campylobacteraceae bacterium]|nr:AsmA-like C-terminal domain-containing protein [Campylobacteraceae bacterium]
KLDTLHIVGDYTNEVLDIHTKDEELFLKIKEDAQVIVTLKNIDVEYDSKGDESLDDKNIVLNGVNSSIIMNNKYKLMSDKYNFVLQNKKISFDSFYKDSLISLKQDEYGLKDISGKNLSSELINTFLTTELLTGGLVNLKSNGFKDKLEGDIIFTENKIKNLAFLTNLILFLNTSPVLINPLFVLPTAINIATNKGVSTDGYFIKKGNVHFVYNLKDDIFHATKINTEGATVDFDGHAILDFKNSTISSSMNVGFLKSYTNLVKSIPVLGYILLGEDKKVTTKVEISGKLDDPEYETHLLKDGANLPLDLIKRIITLPKKALDSIIK